MVVGAGCDIEFGEDVRDVFFHGAFGNHQMARDGEIGAPFGHEGQYVAFPVGEHIEGVGCGAPVADEMSHHLGAVALGAVGAAEVVNRLFVFERGALL
jgi:hypothetical protein